MKTLIGTAAIGLMTFGFATSASAFQFRPESTPFAADGSIVVTAGAVSLPCSTRLTGRTLANGNARISTASFRGVSCAALSASNLPWRIVPRNLSKIRFHHVTVSATVLGICGPGNITAELDAGGVITIAGASLPGLVPCSISGTLQTHPHLRIHG